MRMDYADRSARTGLGRVRLLMMRLVGLFLAGTALLTMALVGLFLVLPVILVGGIALSFYLRRGLRQAQRRKPQDEGVIDAEYTVIDRR